MCGGLYREGFEYPCWAGQEVRGECAVLQPGTEVWSQLPATLNTPRLEHAGVVVGDSLYIIGGFVPSSCPYQDGNTYLDTVERFNSATAHFETLPWTVDNLPWTFTCFLGMGDKLVIGQMIYQDEEFRLSLRVLSNLDSTMSSFTFPLPASEAGYTYSSSNLACGEDKLGKLVVVSLVNPVNETTSQTMCVRLVIKDKYFIDNCCSWNKFSLQTNVFNVEDLTMESQFLIATEHGYVYEYASVYLKGLDRVVNNKGSCNSFAGLGHMQPYTFVHLVLVIAEQRLRLALS